MKIRLRMIALLLCVLTTMAALPACSMLEKSAVEPTEAETATEAPKGFEADENDNYLTIKAAAYKTSPHYEAIQCTVSYDLLNEGQQMLYDRMLENAYIINEITNSHNYKFYNLFRCKQVVLEGRILSEDEVRVTVRAIYDDHPELFWITNYYDYMADEDEDYCAVILYSCYSPKDIRQWLPKVRTTAEQFVRSVPEGLSEYERELAVHDWLIDNCYYNESDANTLEFYHSVYGVLVKSKAVCEGYAKAFQLLLNLLGVECIGIEGEGVDRGEEPDYDDNILHMWNAVKIEGEWYFTDVTWDDVEDTALRHVYLNGNADSFAKSHYPSKLASEMSGEELHKEGTKWALPLNLFVPECNATAYTYIIRECAHLSSYYDTGALIDALTEAAKAGDNSFLIYIDPDFATVDEALSSLILDYPQYIFDYVDSVNYRLSDKRINRNRLAYDYDEDMHYILIILEYD